MGFAIRQRNVSSNTKLYSIYISNLRCGRIAWGPLALRILLQPYEPQCIHNTHIKLFSPIAGRWEWITPYSTRVILPLQRQQLSSASWLFHLTLQLSNLVILLGLLMDSLLLSALRLLGTAAGCSLDCHTFSYFLREGTPPVTLDIVDGRKRTKSTKRTRFSRILVSGLDDLPDLLARRLPCTSWTTMFVVLVVLLVLPSQGLLATPGDTSYQ